MKYFSHKQNSFKELLVNKAKDTKTKTIFQSYLYILEINQYYF